MVTCTVYSVHFIFKIRQKKIVLLQLLFWPIFVFYSPVLEINDGPQTKIKKISFPQSKTVSNFIDLFLVPKLFCFHKIP